MLRHRAHVALLLLGFAATACVTGSPLQRAPEQVDTMVAAIEHVRSEAERSKVSVVDSLEHLRRLAESPAGPEALMGSFTRFLQAIGAAEQQTRRLADSVLPMQAAARPVFAQWEADVPTITSDRLRQRSEQRLAAAQQRYEAIVTAAAFAQQQMEAYVKSLHDHAVFLAHDLNPPALAAIQDEVKVVARSVLELDRSLDSCLGAARSYVDQVTQVGDGVPTAPAR